MAEHYPGLVEQQIGGLALQRSFEAAEQVEQDRDRGLLLQCHQLLDLEDHEMRLGKPVFLGVEQLAEHTFQGVVAQRRANRLVLNLGHEMRQRAVIRRAQQQHRAMDGFPFAGRGRAPGLQLETGRDPILRPG